MSRAVLVAFGVVISAGGLSACGDGVDMASVPRVGGERFEKIRFDDLYRPATATRKERTTIDLVQTETLNLAGASPESVVTTYDKVLTGDGWSEVQPPQEKRDESWYGAWSKLGRNVVVVAKVGTSTEEDQQPPTEFVLSFQRPTKNDQITGVGNDPITG